MLKKILSVDDSASIRQIIKNCLENEGFSVFEASDGVEALQKVQQESYDLFIVDVNMPNMDGITLVRELRKISTYSHTPIIILTTENLNQKKAEGQAAGATGWVVKPFDPAQFIKVIHRLALN